MKNISALYGGGLSTNDSDFRSFAISEINSFSNFPNSLLIKQSIIFFILKIFSIKLLYRMFFFKNNTSRNIFYSKYHQNRWNKITSCYSPPSGSGDHQL